MYEATSIHLDGSGAVNVEKKLLAQKEADLEFRLQKAGAKESKASPAEVDKFEDIATLSTQ